MAEKTGYLKLYRSMTTWEWYKDTNTKIVFLHLLLNANWEPSRYMGHDVPKGGLVVGRKKLAEELGISEQTVRTALEHLKSTNEITIKSTNKFSIVTIVNWDKFQGCEEEITNKVTNETTNSQPTTNQQLTTEEEYKNIRTKEYIKENKTDKSVLSKKVPDRNIIPPTLEMVKAYCEERKNGIDAQHFIDFYESRGWMIGKVKMKNWQAAVRTWEGKRKQETKNDDWWRNA